MKLQFRTALGVALGAFARLYLATLRISLALDASLDLSDPRPWVLCFWHGDQFSLLRWRRRRSTVALVSLSADGQMQAQALAWQGLAVERGSTTRGGAAGLLRTVRRLRRGEDAAIAIDGPRGPRFSVALGALAAARLSGGVLVPMASYAPRGITLRKTWDQFRLPLPFTRVQVVLGPPLEGRAPETTADALARAVTDASHLAEERGHMIGSPAHAVLRHARRA